MLHSDLAQNCHAPIRAPSISPVLGGWCGFRDLALPLNPFSKIFDVFK